MNPSFIIIIIFSVIILNSLSNSHSEIRGQINDRESLFKTTVTNDSVVFPDTIWETKTPAEVVLDENLLDSFAVALGTGENFGGVIIKDGYLVKSWGDQTTKRGWASCKKPVYSTLLFFAINEEILNSPDDSVRQYVNNIFGIDLIQADYGMTFRHLGAMTSGYATSSSPGNSFQYNDIAINLYARLLFHGNGVFGDLSSNILNERLGALQFEDGNVFDGADRVVTTPRDMARIGWFWLNKFSWDTQQLLPQSYFNDYVNSQVPVNLPSSEDSTADDYLNINEGKIYIPELNFGQGIYGFNWWFNNIVPGTSSRTWPSLPVDAFMAFGREGNDKACVLMIPSLNIVVAAYGNWGEMDPGNGTSILNHNLQFLTQAVLPVELTAFTATLNDNSIVLKWSTKTEINNYGFVVERKSHKHWETIGFVKGNGNSNSPKHYSFIDENLFGGSKFNYRLKQIDNDGTFSYSNNIEIIFLPDKFELFQNYPNPFNPSTNIKLSIHEDSKVRLDIFCLLGEHIATLIDENMKTGFYNIPFTAENLASGIYLYKVVVNHAVQTKKMMLLK